jgi:hypothetical protein
LQIKYTILTFFQFLCNPKASNTLSTSADDNFAEYRQQQRGNSFSSVLPNIRNMIARFEGL